MIRYFIKNNRNLDSHDDYGSYLVDRDGYSYNPYSLGWRYLGMYIDCDLDSMYEAQEGRRKLEDNVECTRKLLWAAYVDPKYRGGSIGEYQYFNLTTMEWDKQYCQTKRCARMDCHEPNTHFNLVGVFTETDGLEDWAEQLFKHEGICVWNDDDGYEFMEKYRQIWPNYCYELSLTGDDGSTIYLHMKPEAWGNFTYGIYSDAYCSVESDYVQIHYNYYYGYDGYEAAQTWNSTFEMWNEYMEVYKICQPCRAYSLFPDNSGDNSNDEGRRKLEDNYDDDGYDANDIYKEYNDGDGDEEQWGYNCYDDAGYTNCNQCYKFETHTDYEPAEAEDLERASEQGSILRIKVNGVVYGSGGYTSDPEFSYADIVVITLIGLMAIGMTIFGTMSYLKKDKKNTEPKIDLLEAARKDNNKDAVSTTSSKSVIPAGIKDIFKFKDMPNSMKDVFKINSPNAKKVFGMKTTDATIT